MNLPEMTFLETVNTNLKKAVAIAEKDFLMINGFVKSYYAHIKANEEDNLIHTKMESLVARLQYMDVFSQRVEHLVATHKKMANNEWGANFEESLFHLHVFQAMTIEMDLLESITSIQSLFREFKEHFKTVAQIEWNENDLFAHNQTIIEILQTTIKSLLKAGGKKQNLPIPSLSESQLLILNSLYTMESERAVLSWYLNSMPLGTWEELMQWYEKEINQVEIDNTELF